MVRIVPLDVATHFSAWCWRRLAPIISPKRHNRALDNLRIAFPEKSEAERNAIALEHWENLGRVMAETMRIDQVVADPSRLTIRNPKVFQRYARKLGPIIGASLHMGNWELAIWPLTIAETNPACVYRSVNNPYIDRYLRYQRRDLYPGGMFGRGKVEGEHGESQKTARIIMDFVRRGGQLGVVCDLYDRTGLPVPFFGKDARTVAIPAMIARRAGARIWMSRCIRIGKDSRFEIELKELRIPRTANHGEDVKWATAEMTRQFEEWVREMPEQWMWSNRRWS
ncbi:lipid A biosynthesis lauroyl acyltransferase [Hyphomicrobium denitrificans 1NES1]|uniref:Lipid A biosynthesis lauroyl acyltransferase n=1 Tax=Hyphomicrobium denitrificans 1NES1 TaxID=670307 RepID=N0B3Z9_9HYPH|nr:lipid A biosynthesis acyltransferase [Hyphomicrobium denitrificans]AGK57718.1 lipid A biosynthesis lauroyl acyltransferase [Hyphomicrobium denitrificans 1NES1]